MTVLLAIVISVLAIVAVYTATDVVLGVGGEQVNATGSYFSGCLGGSECNLFGGGG